jgi:hypothetical protein
MPLFIGKPVIFGAYLDPNRDSMQKPIGGRSAQRCRRKRGGRSVLTQKHANSMMKT